MDLSTFIFLVTPFSALPTAQSQLALRVEASEWRQGDWPGGRPRGACVVAARWYLPKATALAAVYKSIA